MKIDLTKDEAEYIVRCLDLGETFTEEHNWTCPRWRPLKINRESLRDKVEKLNNDK